MTSSSVCSGIEVVCISASFQRCFHGGEGESTLDLEAEARQFQRLVRHHTQRIYSNNFGTDLSCM
jgi:hypothetical protein